ncbi:ATP-dependent DNA helicase RecG [Candidatus Daviesbacteria bacterium]|nr:ATP-dependent DNA helicase RecG [Candidatus Daviesbacteria bacterium]
MDLKLQLSQISGIGYTTAKKLERLNLYTLEDLIYHFPFRYDDFSNVSSALDAKVGEKVTLQGEIWSIRNIFTRSRKIITQAIFNDGTSPIELTWFHQSWLTKQIKTGDRLQVSGKVSKYKNKISIVAPVWEKLPETYSLPTTTLHTGRLVPVYPETYGLTSKWLRAKISQMLPKVKEQISDPLPKEVKDSMLDLDDAISKIHFPKNYEDVQKAKERLGFDELFYIQLATQKMRLSWKNKPATKPLNPNIKKVEKFIKGLPFELTSAQKRVIKDVLNDLGRNQPMNRLIQGEVGSGKTVVAAVIMYVTYLNSLKTLFMAPTEVLAFQHLSTVSRLLEPMGIKVGIYTGSRKSEKGDVIIGTHALLSDKLITEDVGLVIIDEQQRFGVGQRTVLRSRGKLPHFLTTTATPIPRTVALTLYGDLDISVIDELPKGRKKINTHVVPSKKRTDAYEFIRKKVKDGDQAYIITPLIELSETLTSAKAATYEYEKLQKQVFSDLKLGILHGRLKSKEKEQVLNGFKDKKIDILVATSVVEVGVDVTNATIMVIESAERFGLAQLHQLRGRVGRGEKQSYCLLFTEGSDSSAISRLKNLEKIDDGLKLAELDLKIRGAGEIFGTRQSGRFDLKIASFSDLTLIEKTREAAKNILSDDPTLDKYPPLQAKLSSLAKEVMPD